MSKTVLTERELAAELGLSAWTVRRMRLQEGCPHFTVGSRVFYRLESVLTWISEREERGRQEPPKQCGVLRKID